MIYDLAIIGAGPAGSAAAKAAAEGGLSVLLLDKAVFPRDKTCGGMLSAKTLDELGFELPDELIQHEAHKVRVYGYNLDSSEWDEKRTIGKAVKRRYFDDFLVHKAIDAGAYFIEGAKLTAIDQNSTGIIIRTSRGCFSARYVIGADGVFSPTAALSGIHGRLPIWQMGFTMEAEVHVPVLNSDYGTAEFYFIPFLGGFGWAFPQKDGYNIGVGCVAWNHKRLTTYFYEFAERILKHKGINAPVPKAKGCFLPAGGIPRRISKSNIVLAGDAAGFVDPFSGEGIYYALRSGHIAAQTLLEVIKAGGDWGKAYARRCAAEFYHDFRLSLLVALVSGKKTQFQYDVLKENPSMVRAIPIIMCQRHPYDTVLKENLLPMPGRMFRTLIHKHA
ncbi:geranylgeranyl reductase family protein [Mahella sp.]|uniref:NAD(P)/FAD-dependent oxidoreductase n=1 Tax=Mahella sp. TaxID=2798721 RepID=UPI0025C4071D|nr:geranylgeranyl reductase family protein [Mahella sp.]MBZ4664758.1 geranylgeranyl reductase [Mahella sp.]